MKAFIRFVLVCTLAACGADASSKPDAGPGDDSGPAADAFGGPDFGEQCTTSSDCDQGGYCVEGTNSDICTYDCDAGCPEGWNCRIVDVLGELVSLCMPQKFDFCKPCSADVQCNGGICVQLDSSGYCLPQCPFEGSCPTGYMCAPDPTGAHTGNYCVPQTGSCTCNAAQAGQVRTCENTNANGTCYGLETCDPDNGGWGACTAGTAGMEVCDGMDNDCDQLIDDGVSGSPCSITNANGTCPGTQICTGSQTLCQGKTPMAETCNFGDDDCDTKTDETFPNVYPSVQPCSAGIGGCERFGVYRCDMAGNGTECSVTAGTPQTEMCNALDDDCDMMTDETFTTLGQACTVGVGACVRTGNQVCNTAGSGTQCSVTPGTGTAETCNNIDDDCDNGIDENFKTNGQYASNTACGSCFVDCTQLYALPNASGVCNASGTPTCQMVCAPNSFNLDGATANGCELVLDPGAIYVATSNGTDDAGCGLGPIGTGAGNYPCKTIAQGLTRATITTRTRVRVANGIYAEAVDMVNGKNLLGGHRPDTWQRDVAGTGTLITGVANITSTNHDYTVRAAGITAATLFEGFVVIGTLNGKIAGNSYAIYVTASSANLAIQNNIVYGGRGGPGSSGGGGVTGLGGVDGVGRESSPTLYDAKVTTGTGFCNVSNNRSYTNGGVRSCGTDNVSGGNGGGNRCNPRPSYDNELSGIDGVTGQVGDPLLGGAGGPGADAGDDMVLVDQSNQPGGELCGVATQPDYGKDGEVGRDAMHGTAGPGCSSASGTVVSGHWVGSTGGAGISGGNGGGGGGGGAGGGAYCAVDGEFGFPMPYLGCEDGKDRLGGHGGGGGSGGCGGTGGTGGAAGGGAFTIFIVGGAAPVITGNTLNRGEGGLGGLGGSGGQGGQGGLGAAGGTSTVFCAGRAGRGGNGGDGGHGAGGGGGCGGGSFGIFGSGIGTPNYCQAAANNAVGSGAGGTGGAGGYSLINTGGSGSTGVLVTCQFN